MKKTKEVEVLVKMLGDDPVSVSTKGEFAADKNTLSYDRIVKSVLIIPIKEKKISITESEFDNAVLNCGVFSSGQHSAIETIKGKLFGE